ncbi:MAG: F0F1 ATP synthase subunit delta [Ilumatobacteraceae bacterium]
MKIDLFTVVAQIVNFMVLVWLLKKFLYKPVLAALDAREQKIAQQLKDAADKKAQATQEQLTLQEKNKAFEAEKTRLLATVNADAQALQKQLTENAKQEYASLQEKYKDAAATEWNKNEARFRTDLTKQVFAIAEKTMKDLASADLESGIIHAFTDEVKKEISQADEALKQTLATEKLSITTAFVLTADARRSLEQALAATTNNRSLPEYQVDSNIIGGITLHCGNYQIAWNIEDYLDALMKHTAAAISDEKMENHESS